MSISLQIWDNFYAISLQVLKKKKQNTSRVYQDSRPPIRKKVKAYLNLTCNNILSKTKNKSNSMQLY